MKHYYEAYEERYKTAHARGVSWAGEEPTPIVREFLREYAVSPQEAVFEIGCGEGRDARAVLASGYRLLAADISEEAIAYCRAKTPEHAQAFTVLDCLHGSHPFRYDCIYAVAVVHMLVLDEDRNAFYRFVREHLKEDGSALICSMGDGEFEMRSDIATAFELQEREHESGRMLVAGTSCRMVSFPTFENEIAANGLRLQKKGLTSSLPDFNSLMYAVVQRA